MVVVKNDPAQSTKSGDFIKTFVAGGIAGCIAKTGVAPLDRVKILLQGHNKHYKHLGVASTIQNVTKLEGIQGLYKGNGVHMIRVFPYAAIQFSTYEQYKQLLKTMTVEPHPHLVKLFAGSMAGLTAILFTYPLDMVRARLAFQVKGEHRYLGLSHAFQSIIHLEGGVRALFRGVVPSLIGMAPYAGLSFLTFESLKNFCLDYFPHVLGAPCPKNTGGLVLIVPAKMLCGGVAGAVAQTVSYPLDVVRRKIQLSIMLPDSHKYQGRWWTILAVIYHDHGITHGLYRGLSINYIRVIPMVSLSFCGYEWMKQIFGLDTGADR